MTCNKLAVSLVSDISVRCISFNIIIISFPFNKGVANISVRFRTSTTSSYHFPHDTPINKQIGKTKGICHIK